MTFGGVFGLLLDKCKRVWVIFTCVGTSNCHAWIVPKNTFRVSGEVAFFTVIEPVRPVSFFFAN